MEHSGMKSSDYIDDLNKLYCTVVGDVCLDMNLSGEYGSRKPAENDSINIFDAEKIVFSPGAAGNIASCLRGLSVNTNLLVPWHGIPWTDLYNSIFASELVFRSIDLVPYQSGTIPLYIKVLDREGKLLHRIDKEKEPPTEGTISRLLETVSDIDGIYNTTRKFIIFADYDEYNENTLNRVDVIDRLHSLGGRFFYTSRRGMYTYFNRSSTTDYVVLNMEEFMKCGSTNMLKVCRDRGIRGGLVVTNGEKGSVGIDMTSEDEYRVDAIPLNLPYNICGCGDMYLAAFSTLVTHGTTFLEAMKYANAAASVVGKILDTTGICSMKDMVRKRKEIGDRT